MKKCLFGSLMMLAATQVNANHMTMYNFTEGVVKGHYLIASERADNIHRGVVMGDSFTVSAVSYDSNGEKIPAKTKVGDDLKTNHSILQCLYVTENSLKCTPIADINRDHNFALIRSFDKNGNEIIGIFPPNVIEGAKTARAEESVPAETIRAIHTTDDGDMIIDWTELTPATPTIPAIPLEPACPAVPAAPTTPATNCDVYYLPIHHGAMNAQLTSQIMTAYDGKRSVHLFGRHNRVWHGQHWCQIIALDAAE